MDRAQKERLADEIFRMQPNMLGSILVLPRLGVPMEKVEFAVGVLLVCFQAMKESGLAWPVITEDEQERQLARFVAATRLGEDIAPSLRSRALRRYIAAHPEKGLAATWRAIRRSGWARSRPTSPTSTRCWRCGTW